MAQKTTTRQKPTQLKPLNIEQEHAVDCLISGQTDAETAAAVGVARTTISEWRHHPLFVATVNARRAELWRAPQEKLLGLALKAVENLAASVEGGDLKSSLEVLKAISLYGRVPQMGESDPFKVLQATIEARVKEEQPEDTMTTFLNEQVNPGARARREQIELELWGEYGETESP